MKIEKIYFDMDGVLADFDRGVREICGLTPQSQNAKHRSLSADDAMWVRIKEAGHYYDRLELMPGAKEMFDTVFAKYGENCQILTGIPKPRRGIDSAAEDKVSWVRRLLSDQVKVNTVLREDKVNYCTGKGCVLIDDAEKNIKQWETMGGTGILHVSAADTQDRLFFHPASVPCPFSQDRLLFLARWIQRLFRFRPPQ